MAQDIDTGDLSVIAAGGYASTYTLLFDLPTGIKGFWGGSGLLTIDGIDYVGAGSLIQMEALAAGTDLSASPVSVTLRAVPEQGLTPDVLATIDDEDYKGRPAAIGVVFFARNDGTLKLMLPRWRGYIDTVTHDWDVGANNVLTGSLEPRSLDHSRRGFRVRGDADQRLIDPDDTFYLHAATVASEQVTYGRASPTTAGAGGNFIESVLKR